MNHITRILILGRRRAWSGLFRVSWVSSISTDSSTIFWVLSSLCSVSYELDDNITIMTMWKIILKYQHNIDIFTNLFASRIDTGDDNRVSKEEFCAENVKASVEKWTGETLEDMEAEFDSIDENGGGQILFGEFVKWALDKNLDIEDDVDEAVAPE